MRVCVLCVCVCSSSSPRRGSKASPHWSVPPRACAATLPPPPPRGQERKGRAPSSDCTTSSGMESASVHEAPLKPTASAHSVASGNRSCTYDPVYLYGSCAARPRNVRGQEDLRRKVSSCARGPAQRRGGTPPLGGLRGRAALAHRCARQRDPGSGRRRCAAAALLARLRGAPHPRLRRGRARAGSSAAQPPHLGDEGAQRGAHLTERICPLPAPAPQVPPSAPQTHLGDEGAQQRCP